MHTALARMPSEETRRLAKDAIEGFREAIRKRRSKKRTANVVRLRPGEGDDVVEVPRAAFDLFLDILANMADGNAVTLMPIHAELTTQQAAEILNVSRPFLVKLLEEGKIAFHHVGSHRRIRAEDLFQYRESEQARGREVLAQMTAEAQEMGLYD